MPRTYRGRDVFAWLHDAGQLDVHADEVPNLAAARRAPSFPVSGAAGGSSLGLDRLAGAGRRRHRPSDRLHRPSGAVRAPTLERELRDADRRLRRALAHIDAHIERTAAARRAGRDAGAGVARSRAARVSSSARDVRTVLWATGYRRSYPWLEVPVLDATGELLHREGVTPAPGLFALGLRFQRTRKSHFLGGVGDDAARIAEHIVADTGAARLRRAA